MRTQPHRVRALRLLGLATALSLTMCAGKREAKLRASWDKAVRDAAAEQQRAGDEDGGDGDNSDEHATEWRELESFVGRVVDEVALGLATVSMDRLTASMCAEAPDVDRLGPEETGPRVFHCTPEPPQTILGEAMTLELSETGEVGLVATGLTDKLSAKLLAQAVERVAPWCDDTLRETAHEKNALFEFHTCMTPAGPRLAVGRFPSEGEEERWQFSLVVLIPG